METAAAALPNSNRLKEGIAYVATVVLAVGFCFQAAASKATVGCRVCNRLYTLRIYGCFQLSCPINPYINNDPEVPE